MKKKIPKLLILYASAGAGHKQAARAIRQVAEERSLAIAKDIDILDYTPAYFKKLYRGSYLEIVRRIPELWGYLFDRSYKYKKPTLTSRLHHTIGNMYLAPLVKYVREFKPDALVFTHFLGWEALGSLRRLKVLNIPFFCIVTDFTIHSFWISRYVNKYYVATAGEARILKSHGFRDKQINVTGIPVSPAFAKPFSRTKLRKKLKLSKGIPVVLLISGRYNLTGYEQLLASFKDVKQRLQIIVLAGKNKLLMSRLKHIAKGLKNKKVAVYGMVDNMHELMQASDIVVSKPGGLTTSEVLASRTLMGVIDPIPGQEMRNSDYLLEAGVAIRIHDMETGGPKIADLLKSKRRLTIMRRHLKYVSRSRAAYEIVKDITSTLK
ncbi:MAG: hypothetical protein HQ572_05225 [Candidatus Omnitrophica bacterium]|nr:hypothetical protein [Candidatus Omnitrophota bacterium]